MKRIFRPRQVQWFINGHKDEGRRPSHIDDENDPITAQYIRVYTAYEAACERAGAVDFAELLLRGLESSARYTGTAGPLSRSGSATPADR